MREAIATGETVELAKEAACRQLGVESYEAEFEILEMPMKKTFGLFGGNPAKVRVYIQDNPAEKAADYLKKVLANMGLPGVQVEIKEEENGAMLCLSGDEIGYVIGHRGETLDALQYLAGLVANHAGDSYYRINLDIGNYRDKRRQTLETLGRKMAEKSLRTGRNASLEPMNPYERRIIHTAVQTVEGAKSWSEGEDAARHVVIGPTAGERPVPRRNFSGNGRRGGGPRGGRPPYRPGQQQHGGARPPRQPYPADRRAPAQQGSPTPRTERPATTSLYGKVETKK